MKKRRVHVWIEGRVRGVAFRAYTRDMATRNGIAGWVRNLPDGRVEAIFEGDDDRVEVMLAWCRQGTPYSRVDGVAVREEEVLGDTDRFEIRF